MPKSFVELVRESLFRPRTAARYVVGLNLPKNVILQATLLLAVLSVLSQYMLFNFIGSQTANTWTVSFPLPIVDVGQQFLGAFIVGGIVVFLSRAIQTPVELYKAITVYLWVNFILLVLLAAMLVGMLVFSPLALVILLFTIFWSPYALAVFWSELLGSTNLFLGFVVAVVAILLASAISVIVATIIGLPMMEIIPNV